MKMTTETKFALAGITAGTVMAGAPIAYGFYINSKRGPFTNQDFLSLENGKFTTKYGEKLVLYGTSVDDFAFNCAKNGEVFSKTPRETFDEISKRFGNYGAREIFASFLEKSVTSKDIKKIKKQGYNCIKIPLRSFLLFKDEKIKKHDPVTDRLDKIIKICGKHGIYVVLSLVETPGFSNDSSPKEFLDCGNKGFEMRNEAIKLWAKTSKIYKDNPTVAAYEILPNPFEKGVAVSGDYLDLEAYSKFILRLTNALRSLEDEHIIITNYPIENSENTICGVHLDNPTEYEINAVAEDFYQKIIAKTPFMVSELKAPTDSTAFNLLNYLSLSFFCGTLNADNKLKTIDLALDPYKKMKF